MCNTHFEYGAKKFALFVCFFVSLVALIYNYNDDHGDDDGDNNVNGFNKFVEWKTSDTRFEQIELDRSHRIASHHWMNANALKRILTTLTSFHTNSSSNNDNIQQYDQLYCSWKYAKQNDSFFCSGLNQFTLCLRNLEANKTNETINTVKYHQIDCFSVLFCFAVFVHHLPSKLYNSISVSVSIDEKNVVVVVVAVASR